MFQRSTIEQAIATHGTVFFDSSLQPVVPQIGQWFCEYEVGNDGEMRDEAIVEYLGKDTEFTLCNLPHGLQQWIEKTVDCVASEHDESSRQPLGLCLILQN